ncbi:hypothetical protein Y032_0113g345 [Ancylostoma ceylanicum]|uniref:Uncharacterized protein n=1 Tax=Ancylostoma ceylanicum TaxID=53326 RepID=A0A016TD98_9BILA|nr:hypothetical protein Y032_0113g345 [Ancylostoma ceylanicum]
MTGLCLIPSWICKALRNRNEEGWPRTFLLGESFKNLGGETPKTSRELTSPDGDMELKELLDVPHRQSISVTTAND